MGLSTITPISVECLGWAPSEITGSNPGPTLGGPGMNLLQVFEGTGFMVEFRGCVVALGCPRKLGSMLTKWVSSPTCKWDILGLQLTTHLLSIDPNFLGHPSRTCCFFWWFFGLKKLFFLGDMYQ